MEKQYVYIETLETGEKSRYTFSNRKQLREFINALLKMSDMPEQFEVKVEYIVVSI